MKKIISLRKDANGSRFLGMIAAFYVAEKLNVKPCFHWYDYVELGYEKTSDSSSFYFNDQKILSVGADSKEDIFDKDFLKEFHIDNFKDEEIVFADTPGAWLANIDDIRAALYKDDGKKYVECVFHFFRFDNKNRDKHKDFPQKAVEIFNDKIKFNEDTQEVIHKAKNLAKSLGDFTAIHIRSGDSIYSYAPYRKHIFFDYQATSAHIAIELINSINGKVVLFGDDISTMRQIKEFVNDDRLFVAQDLKEKLYDETGGGHSLSVTKSFLFDVVFMSRAKDIFGTKSGVVNLASQIGNANFIYTHSYIQNKKAYYSMKKNLEQLALNKDQQACSYYYTFLLADKLNIDISFQEYCLKKALELDEDNDKYRFHLVLYYLKHYGVKRADEYLGDILKSRKKEFLDTISTILDGFHTYASNELKLFFVHNDKKFPNFAVIKQDLIDKGLIWRKNGIKYILYSYITSLLCKTGIINKCIKKGRIKCAYYFR